MSSSNNKSSTTPALDPATEKTLAQIRDLVEKIGRQRTPTNPLPEEPFATLITAAATFASTIVGHALVLVDFRGTILFANAGIGQYGWGDGSELRGRPLLELVPQRYHAAHAQAFAKFAEGHPPRFKSMTGNLFWVRCRDGSEIYSSVSVGRIPLLGQNALAAQIHPVHTHPELNVFTPPSSETP